MTQLGPPGAPGGVGVGDDRPAYELDWGWRKDGPVVSLALLLQYDIGICFLTQLTGERLQATNPWELNSKSIRGASMA
jgi:hypothetical protein